MNSEEYKKMLDLEEAKLREEDGVLIHSDDWTEGFNTVEDVVSPGQSLREELEHIEEDYDDLAYDEDLDNWVSFDLDKIEEWEDMTDDEQQAIDEFFKRAKDKMRDIDGDDL